MLSCGFAQWDSRDWEHDAPAGAPSSARRMLGTSCGSAADCVPVGSSCAAGFFSRLKTKEERAGWCIAATQGERRGCACRHDRTRFTLAHCMASAA